MQLFLCHGANASCNIQWIFFKGWIPREQVGIKQRCHWLSAPGSPAAVAVIWLLTQALPESQQAETWLPNLNFQALRRSSGWCSSLWSPRRRLTTRATLSPCSWAPSWPWWAAAPSSAGTRGGGTTCCEGGSPDRAACPVLLSSTALILLCVIWCGPSGTKRVSKQKLMRNVPYWDECATETMWTRMQKVERKPGSPGAVTVLHCSDQNTVAFYVKRLLQLLY